jgi:hypothetical protein
MQCSPQADCPRRRPEFTAGGGRTWPKEGPGVPRGFTHVDLGRIPGRSRRRRAPTAGPRRCARWSPVCRRPCRRCGVQGDGEGCLGSRGGREVVGRQESSGAKLGGGSGHGERRRYTGSTASLWTVIFGTAPTNRRGRGRGAPQGGRRGIASGPCMRVAPVRCGLGLGAVHGGKARRRPHGGPLSTTKLSRHPYAGRTRGRHMAGAAAARAQRAGRGDDVSRFPFYST